MKFSSISSTLLQSDDARYQISRGPGPTPSKYTYRAWRRADNHILATVDVWDEAEERKRAVDECKAACRADCERPIDSDGSGE
jgi:hypothetical protein